MPRRRPETPSATQRENKAQSLLNRSTVSPSPATSRSWGCLFFDLAGYLEMFFTEFRFSRPCGKQSLFRPQSWRLQKVFLAVQLGNDFRTPMLVNGGELFGERGFLHSEYRMPVINQVRRTD
jgi:hypothetical protein